MVGGSFHQWYIQKHLSFASLKVRCCIQTYIVALWYKIISAVKDVKDRKFNSKLFFRPPLCFANNIWQGASLLPAWNLTWFEMSGQYYIFSCVKTLCLRSAQPYFPKTVGSLMSGMNWWLMFISPWLLCITEMDIFALSFISALHPPHPACLYSPTTQHSVIVNILALYLLWILFALLILLLKY